MFGLFSRRKAPKDDGAATPDQFVVPVDLNAAHSFAAPSPTQYPSPPTYGAQPYAPRIGVDLPTIRDQDRILVHHFQPNPARTPEEWYHDRNRAKIAIGRHEEMFQTLPVVAVPGRQPDAINPWDHTPVSTRPTSMHAPVSYRMVRPFDQRWERTGDGRNGSLATLGRAYPVGGMQSAQNFRNTIRIAPAARDTENYDLSGTETHAVTPAVYVSPQINTERRYGL